MGHFLILNFQGIFHGAPCHTITPPADQETFPPDRLRAWPVLKLWRHWPYDVLEKRRAFRMKVIIMLRNPLHLYASSSEVWYWLEFSLTDTSSKLFPLKKFLVSSFLIPRAIAWSARHPWPFYTHNCAFFKTHLHPYWSTEWRNWCLSFIFCCLSIKLL